MELTEGMTTIEQALMSQASLKRTPINGSLELLPLCNMNCDMCYVRLSREEMERQGRMRTGDEWIENRKADAKSRRLVPAINRWRAIFSPGIPPNLSGASKYGDDFND